MQDELAARFEADRAHLRTVAYRMLGSSTEADDAVQEAWLRLSRSDTSDVDNLTGWLTTVVARVSLTMLQSRTRRPLPVENLPEASVEGPEDDTVLADSVGLALLVVLDTLTPAERLAFVLHDMFAVPFEEIAPIVGRTPAATRQLASRGRRRVRGAPEPDDRARQEAVVRAFLSASREGDFEELVALLDPDVIVRSDQAASGMSANAPGQVDGVDAVARVFAGRAQAARLALIDGVPGAIWAQGGVPRVAFRFTVEGNLVTRIDFVADPDTLAGFDIEFLRWSTIDS